MNISQKAWQYDPTTRMVTEDNGREVICTIAAGQPDSIGHTLAGVPRVFALADAIPPLIEKMQANLTNLASHDNGKAASAKQALLAAQLLGSTPALVAIANDLHTQLGASLSAWHGEEDSVQEEHSDLIKELEAADARASAVLNAPGDAALPADTLRALAKSLLDRAEQLDGLQPYVVTHAHRFGQTVYTAWSAGAPNETQMASLLEEEFEGDRGETLESHRLEIAELTGTAPTSVLAPVVVDDEEEDENVDRPAGM